ncbi:alanine racemase [Alkalicoccobacillus porphyridii]|uniref:YhfX family PLP-dependent enzyme n=1 Tax=Alkalicoccobacillus porphyridii TaxID=2597270 RepID=A0A554A4F0_9BACI|nr:alanine racemase [Alkalicoccobacillus porphyridii]TSB48552.1 YhfX family PLP-dependent enzyme [Alkalicoccobacillus porphyridii]
MFIDMTLRRNEGLIKAGTKLHQEGTIAANTYVIDLDSLEYNVKSLSETASEHSLSLYYMTKQIGRSGFIGDIIARNGIEKAVAVDIDEAIQLKSNNCQIGNFGHIVQPSRSQWKYVLTDLKPEVITLFSYERAEQLSRAAESLGIIQDVILRVIRTTDSIYPGQFGGFLLHELDPDLDKLKSLKGITVVGITSFPVLQMNDTNDDFTFTSNLETLKLARGILENNNITVKHINAPSATSCYTIPMLKEHGVTHGEPGHAITGTTPLHAYNPYLKEVPSIIYVSEISHMDDQSAYTIAGGFYNRSNMEYALFGQNGSQLTNQLTQVGCNSPTNIDYYGSLKKQAQMKVGDTAIYAFRTQIFVTRAHIAYVRGVNTNNPKLVYLQRRGM